MIDFEQIYNTIKEQANGNQKKLPVNSPLGIFFGYSPEGMLRLSFMSSCQPPKLESTKILRVSQGKERNDVFWTCYDLLAIDAQKVYFTFCENLIEAVSGNISECKALSLLKKRYITWKSMFKKEVEKSIPHEVLQGLFGELYFMKKFMIPKYGTEIAIRSWSGPDLKSKDFSVGTDWFEIKTVGANTSTVEISSLTQLSSDRPGHLAIIRVEEMSEEFDNGESSIGQLLKGIITDIDNETVEGIFLTKLSRYGFDISDESINLKFNVKAFLKYAVDYSFPRITEDKISHPAICDIRYSLSIVALNAYKEK